MEQNLKSPHIHWVIYLDLMYAFQLELSRYKESNYFTEKHKMLDFSLNTVFKFFFFCIKNFLNTHTTILIVYVYCQNKVYLFNHIQMAALMCIPWESITLFWDKNYLVKTKNLLLKINKLPSLILKGSTYCGESISDR